MTEDKLKKLLAGLRAQAADRAEATAPPGPDCLSDDEVSALASSEAPPAPLAPRLFEHVIGCARCSSLLSVVLDAQPPADWAVAATQAATERWLAEQPATERPTVFGILMAWLPGLAPPEPQFAASYAARPEPVTIAVTEGQSEVRLRLGTSEAPAANAEVELVGAASDETIAQGNTDEDGLVQFADIEPGRYSVRVEEYDGPLKLSAPSQ